MTEESPNIKLWSIEEHVFIENNHLVNHLFLSFRDREKFIKRLQMMLEGRLLEIKPKCKVSLHHKFQSKAMIMLRLVRECYFKVHRIRLDVVGDNYELVVHEWVYE